MTESTYNGIPLKYVDSLDGVVVGPKYWILPWPAPTPLEEAAIRASMHERYERWMAAVEKRLHNPNKPHRTRTFGWRRWVYFVPKQPTDYQI